LPKRFYEIPRWSLLIRKSGHRDQKGLTPACIGSRLAPRFANTSIRCAASVTRNMSAPANESRIRKQVQHLLISKSIRLECTEDVELIDVRKTPSICAWRRLPGCGAPTLCAENGIESSIANTFRRLGRFWNATIRSRSNPYYQPDK